MTPRHLFLKKSGAGFSLVETVVLVAISVVALVALVNLFFMFNTIYHHQQAFMQTAGSSGASMQAIHAAILQAAQVLPSYNFSGTTHTSSATTLVLALPAVDTSGEIVPGATDYVAFYASPPLLYRLTAASVGSMRTSGLTILSTTLSSLSFTYEPADVALATNVLVDIETEGSFKGHTVQSHLYEQVYLRNKTP